MTLAIVQCSPSSAGGGWFCAGGMIRRWELRFSPDGKLLFRSGHRPVVIASTTGVRPPLWLWLAAMYGRQAKTEQQARHAVTAAKLVPLRLRLSEWSRYDSDIKAAAIYANRLRRRHATTRE